MDDVHGKRKPPGTDTVVRNIGKIIPSVELDHRSKSREMFANENQGLHAPRPDSHFICSPKADRNISP